MHRFKDLSTLIEMQYHQAQQSLAVLIEEERRVRDELAKLEEHKNLTRLSDYEGAAQMRGLGADILWEKWLEKTRRALNLKLARILAKKERHLAEVSKHFGKLQAAQKQIKKMQHTLKKHKNEILLEKAISMSKNL